MYKNRLLEDLMQPICNAGLNETSQTMCDKVTELAYYTKWLRTMLS